MIDKDRYADKIRWVAASFGAMVEFRSRGREAAGELGSESIEVLATMFHDEHSPPEELADKFPGLGAWITARQFAIFEIFYNLREPALTVLRRVAFGKYDWTQGNAIEVLCRLAAEGVEREQIIAEIWHAFPKIRHEAQLYSMRPLLSQAQDNPALAAVMKEFDDIPAFQRIRARFEERQRGN